LSIINLPVSNNKIGGYMSKRNYAAERKFVHQKGRRDKLLAEGKCWVCGNERDSWQKRCIKCSGNMHRTQRKIYQGRVAAGVCGHCGDVVVGEIGYCEKHWLQRVSIDITKKECSAEELKQLLESQNYICPYTNEKIIPGVNASLDHKIPQSRGGAHDLGNLQWVIQRVNMMKQNMLHDEFLDLCRKVVAHTTK